MHSYRLRLFLAALLSLQILSLSSFADEPDLNKSQITAVNQLKAAALKDTKGYALIESLTTEVGPRLAGTDAEARAREWAVRHLKKLGFKNVRVEPFTLPSWRRIKETAEIVSPYPQKLFVTALGGSVSTGKDGVEGEIVSVASLADLQALKDQSLRGKIVFIDESMSRTQDGSGYSVAVKKRGQTAYEAHRTGAVAALIRSVGTSSHRFPHTGQMKRITDTSAGPSVPTAALSAPDADQLARALERKQAVVVKLTITTETQQEARSGNVIAEIPGRSAPEEIVLIGAHLDSWDLGTGAIDDGAGVGIVVAAANIIKNTLKKRPKRTIRIVLFGSEEVGLVGAKKYVEHHKDTLHKHIIAAESDFGADVIWRFDTNVAPSKEALAGVIGKALRPLKIGPGLKKTSGGPDMTYLHEAGVPVVDLLQNGWDYFDLHHTPNDTFDKIELAKLQQNIAAYSIFAYLAANLDGHFREDKTE